MSAVNNELALFQPAVREQAVEEVDWINYRPIGQITKSSAIEFLIPGTSSEYILLSKSRLHVKLRVLREDGATQIDNTDEVALENLSLHSLFRQVDVSLNQQVVTTTVGVNYPYKAMLDVLINYGYDIKESILQSEGYYKDSSGEMEGTSTNAGYLKRRTLTRYGIADLEGPLHMDCAVQGRAILPGVQIAIKLFQSDDSFRLHTQSGKSYEVEITDAIFKVCHLKLRPSVILAHGERLKKSPAIYPFWKSDVKTYTISKGSYSWSIDDMWHSYVPSKLMVAFVASEAYTGDYTKNPFNFQNCKLNYIDLAIDGRSVPSQALTPKFEVNPDVPGTYLPTGFVSEYLNLFKSQYPPEGANFINLADFPEGYAIYMFDLKPGTGEDLYSTLGRGHTRLTARFDEGLASPITVIAYGQFPGEFRIDQTRNVLL